MQLFFFFNDTATTEIYTLSLHDALPILAPSTDLLVTWSASFDAWRQAACGLANRNLTDGEWRRFVGDNSEPQDLCPGDRKSTRLNSSHANISYAVFCLKKQ